MNVRETLLAALRRDPDLVPKVRGSLRERIDDEGAVATVLQAAEALEPIIADALRKRPSRIKRLGLKSAQLLAALAAEDDGSSRQLATIARGSTVGIVFADVAGFTAMTERLGDVGAIRVLSRVEQLVERELTRTRGECVKQLGDGFLLAFPSASQAVRGALALRESVGRERARDPEFHVSLRIAVHAGEPLVSGNDLLGLDVNLAARLLDHCKPDRVVVSEAAKELAERRLRSVDFTSRRAVKIRGLSGRTTIYTARPAPRVAGG
ncbi:MAG: adenylate/guanylate cyclase domain-containing protein [Actinomycetota bacterium]|nr:adenylate/guanylate cyclase domain-containing protein [Actinomycetota bacterium]